VSLSRAGVTNVEKVIRIGPQLYHARLGCFVELGPRQRGAHMSRFEEVVNDVIGEVVLGEGGFKAEDLARRIAVAVRERQDAERAEVTIAARYPGPAGEIYTLLGTAVASADGARRVVGVATGGGTLQLGLPEACETEVDAAELLAIVKGSASESVEDRVREAIAGTIGRFRALGGDALVAARQERDGVMAEHSGLFGELAAAGPDAHHTTLREWLSAAGSARRPGP
jgi:GTP cyclohydrolase IV